MIDFRNAMASGLLLTMLGACSMAPMMTSTTITARLSGASEVPAVSTNASGTVEAKLNKQTNELSWTVTYSGLSGPAKAAHFHGPALAGENVGVAVPLVGNLDSPIAGTAVLTATQISDLMAGKWYLNVHTAAHPGGEIRGQLAVKP